MFKVDSNITKELQEKLNECGEVIIPSGKYFLNTIRIYENTTLILEEGCELEFSDKLDDYKKVEYYHAELGDALCCIYALDAKNIKICGKGKILLNGSSYFDLSRPHNPYDKEVSQAQLDECTRQFKYGNNMRVNQPLMFKECHNLSIEDIEILDSPCWTITIIESKNVNIRDMKIMNSMIVPNSDGIHLCGCEDVNIDNIHIESGDDCVAISSITDWNIKSKNIIIRNSYFKSASKAISIGYINSYVENVVVDNVQIEESNRGIVLMASPPSAKIKNIKISNSKIAGRIYPGNWWGNGEPIVMMAVPHNWLNQSIDRKYDVNIENIELENVELMGEMPMGIIGENKNINNISLKNCNIDVKATKNIELFGRNLDFSPSQSHYIVNEDEALVVDQASNLSLDNVKASNKILIK